MSSLTLLMLCSSWMQIEASLVHQSWTTPNYWTAFHLDRFWSLTSSPQWFWRTCSARVSVPSERWKWGCRLKIQEFRPAAELDPRLRFRKRRGQTNTGWREGFSSVKCLGKTLNNPDGQSWTSEHFPLYITVCFCSVLDSEQNHWRFQVSGLRRRSNETRIFSNPFNWIREFFRIKPLLHKTNKPTNNSLVS